MGEHATSTVLVLEYSQVLRVLIRFLVPQEQYLLIGEEQQEPLR